MGFRVRQRLQAVLGPAEAGQLPKTRAGAVQENVRSVRLQPDGPVRLKADTTRHFLQAGSNVAIQAGNNRKMQRGRSRCPRSRVPTWRPLKDTMGSSRFAVAATCVDRTAFHTNRV